MDEVIIPEKDASKKFDASLLDMYREIKGKIKKLQEQEAILRKTIINLMEINNVNTIENKKIKLILKELERIYYLKKDIEANVPKDILEKIKKVQKVKLFQSRLK